MRRTSIGTLATLGSLVLAHAGCGASEGVNPVDAGSEEKGAAGGGAPPSPLHGTGGGGQGGSGPHDGGKDATKD